MPGHKSVKSEYIDAENKLITSSIDLSSEDKKSLAALTVKSRRKNKAEFNNHISQADIIF